MLNASWKGKDYDSKIALLNSESAIHKQQLGYHDEQIAEIRTLLELKDHPTLLETSAQAPRDNKAMQQIVQMVNAQKATTDRH